jgi:hypothetical protein
LNKILVVNIQLLIRVTLKHKTTDTVTDAIKGSNQI